MSHHAKHDDRYPPKEPLTWKDVAAMAQVILVAIVIFGLGHIEGYFQRSAKEWEKAAGANAQVLARIEAELREQKDSLFATRMAIEGVAKRLGETRAAITADAGHLSQLLANRGQHLEKRLDRFEDQLQGTRVDVMNRLDHQASRIQSAIDKSAMETIPVVLKLADEINARLSVIRGQLTEPTLAELAEQIGALRNALMPRCCRAGRSPSCGGQAGPCCQCGAYPQMGWDGRIFYLHRGPGCR